MVPARSRLWYTLTACVVVALGLVTRPLKPFADAFVSAFGDALYAVLVYLLIGVALPRLRPLWVFFAATFLAAGVEVGQLFHPAWLSAVRRTLVGGLALGGTFSVGDLWCCLAGTLIAFGCELFWKKRKEEHEQTKTPSTS